MVTDRIAEYRYQQLDTVLLFDDADRAGEDTLAQIARIAQFDCSPDARLTIVMASSPGGVRRLGESLLERTELRIDIEPWSPTDTEDYVRASLARAGRESPLFDAPAIRRLHQLGDGIPRRITQLADLALLAGAGQQLDAIDEATVESVYHELGVIEV